MRFTLFFKFYLNKIKYYRCNYLVIYLTQVLAINVLEKSVINSDSGPRGPNSASNKRAYRAQEDRTPEELH